MPGAQLVQLGTGTSRCKQGPILPPLEVPDKAAARRSQHQLHLGIAARPPAANNQSLAPLSSSSQLRPAPPPRMQQQQQLESRPAPGTSTSAVLLPAL